MSLSEAQNKLYWRLWAALRKAEPGVDRHATHEALGLPASHTEWKNSDFDEWKKHCLAKSQPGNYRAQVQQLRMPEIRRRVFIDYLLAAMELTEDYAEGILQQMNRRGKQGGQMVTLDTLPEAELEDVMVALKKECRRRWKTKEMLLGEIQSVRASNNFDPVKIAAAVQSALCWKSLPALEKMYYEPLLVALSVLRRAAKQPAPVLVAVEAGEDPDWTA